MDDTLTSVGTHSRTSDLNGLKLLDEIKPYSLSNVVPGNAPNNTRNINKLTASDISISSCDSIEAYPLVEDKDPPEINDIIPEVKMPKKSGSHPPVLWLWIPSPQSDLAPC